MELEKHGLIRRAAGVLCGRFLRRLGFSLAVALGVYVGQAVVARDPGRFSAALSGVPALAQSIDLVFSDAEESKDQTHD